MRKAPWLRGLMRVAGPVVFLEVISGQAAGAPMIDMGDYEEPDEPDYGGHPGWVGDGTDIILPDGTMNMDADIKMNVRRSMDRARWRHNENRRMNHPNLPLVARDDQQYFGYIIDHPTNPAHGWQ